MRWGNGECQGEGQNSRALGRKNMKRASGGEEKKNRRLEKVNGEGVVGREEKGELEERVECGGVVGSCWGG